MRRSVSQLVAPAAQCQPSNLRNLPTALEAELTALAGSLVKSEMEGACMKRLQELSGLQGSGASVSWPCCHSGPLEALPRVMHVSVWSWRGDSDIRKGLAHP